MKVLHSLDDARALAGVALALGNFDGVHLGHRALFRRAAEHGRPGALTFEPHPGKVLQPELAPRLITPLPRKLQLLEAAGLDVTVVLPFTLALARTPAKEFERKLFDVARVARGGGRPGLHLWSTADGDGADPGRSRPGPPVGGPGGRPGHRRGGGGLLLPHPGVHPRGARGSGPGAARPPLRPRWVGGEGGGPGAGHRLSHCQRGHPWRAAARLGGLRGPAGGGLGLAGRCGQHRDEADLRWVGGDDRGARARLVGATSTGRRCGWSSWSGSGQSDASPRSPSSPHRSSGTWKRHGWCLHAPRAFLDTVFSRPLDRLRPRHGDSARGRFLATPGVLEPHVCRSPR